MTMGINAARRFQGTPGIRRAHPVLAKAIKSGATIQQLHSLIRQSSIDGKSVRNRTLGLYRKDVLAQQEGIGRLRRLGRNVRPDPANMPTALTNIRKNFSSQVLVEGTFEGEKVSRYVTVTRDTAFSQSEAEKEALHMVRVTLGDSGELRKWSDVKFTFDEQIKNPFMV